MEKEIIGKRFGLITVLSVEKSKKNNDKHMMIKGVCDCGKNVFTRMRPLINGKVKSCGCLNIAKNIENNTKHGYFGTRIYSIWNGIMSRTKYKSSKDKKRYWGRGISVCKDWENFITFKDWSMKNGYKDNLTIDRIDNDGNYSPDNCRWVHMKEQYYNKSNTVYVDYCGKKVTLEFLSKISGLSKGCIIARLRKMSVNEALSIPIHRKICVLYENKKYSLRGLCNFLCLPYKKYHARYMSGKRIEDLIIGATPL